MLILSDSSPLIGLYNIGKLELIPAVFGKVIIPDAVYNELSQEHESGTIPLDKHKWLEVKTVSDQSYLNKLSSDNPVLGQGELEAIALSVELHADLLLIDERKGRALAKELRITTTGILGILTTAKQKGLIPNIAEPIKELTDSGFRLSEKLISFALQKAGEL